MVDRHTNPRGKALARELKWIHDALRQDLQIVTRLSQAVLDGVAAGDVQSQVRELSSSSPIWAFRAHCLHFCRFVDMHHKLESAHLFPAVRASDPAMVAVSDRLDAEHATVAAEQHQVEAAIEDLLADDTTAHRDRAAAALRALGADLLAHLDYEEEQLVPLLSTWTSWP